MSRYPGAIDCDIHPTVPGIGVLLPYMDDYWREAFVSRGIDGLEMANYPPGAPISCRADWRPAKGRPAADPATIARQSLDVMGTRACHLQSAHRRAGGGQRVPWAQPFAGP